MLKYKGGIQYFLDKLRNGDHHSNNAIFKEMTNSIQVFNNQDLQFLLEFLMTVDDITLELKLISFLAICLATNDNHYEVIASYNPLYEKMEAILSKGLHLRATTVLNFITALVYDDDVECMYSKRKTLVLYVRNSIRVSGCLGTMTTLFTSSMMFLDTWKALCQSIAEVCRNCDLNKAQCGHLISPCVQKCLQGFKDVITVLQSLLHDNPRNVQLFLSCNGIQIFTRETLQGIHGLQLLSTLINNPQVASLIRNTDTPAHVTEILHWNGPHSQKGQWCTTIMYYLDSCDKRPLSQSEKAQDTEEHNNIMENTVAKEANTKIHSGIEDINMQDDVVNVTDHPNDDTTKLFRNVVKEIFYWKSKEKANTNRTISIPQAVVDPTKFRDTCVNSPSEYSAKPKHSYQNNNYYQQEYEQKELSFSFLRQAAENNNPPKKYRDHFQQDNPSPHRQSNFVTSERLTKTVDRSVKYLSEKSVQTNFESKSAAFWQLNVGDDDESTLASKHFMPQVMSTPKRDRCNGEHKIKDNSLPYYRKKNTKRSASSYVPTRHVYKERRRKVYKTVKKSSPVKSGSTSMSARFFSAINESCTTLVKTVKKVFTSEIKDNALNKTRKASSSYSFMDYMRKRDAILGKDYIGDSKQDLEGFVSLSMGVKEGNACKTCNDTAMLKQKLDNNEYLRKTVQKLKLGINLYGCDFNKISKTFWPQDTFMSPAVLYNLYRKLILK